MDNKINQLVVGPIATNCWIYRMDQTAAVIDPGAEPEVILSVLQEMNLTLKYILLTHGHFDHIGALAQVIGNREQVIGNREEGKGNREEGVENREQIEIAIHKADACYLGADAYSVHLDSIGAMGEGSSILDLFWPEKKDSMPNATRLLEEGDTIGPFTVLHLPGHTPGSVAFWDKEQKVLFSGDTLFKGGYGRTDLPGGNEQELIKSLRRLFAMDKDITVCPGHGGVTMIGKEQ